MTLQHKKYKLIEWITSLKDESLLNLLHNIQDSHSHPFSKEDEERISIALEKSEEDIKAGRVHKHEDVMTAIRTRYDLKE